MIITTFFKGCYFTLLFYKTTKVSCSGYVPILLWCCQQISRLLFEVCCVLYCPCWHQGYVYAHRARHNSVTSVKTTRLTKTLRMCSCGCGRFYRWHSSCPQASSQFDTTFGVTNPTASTSLYWFRVAIFNHNSITFFLFVCFKRTHAHLYENKTWLLLDVEYTCIRYGCKELWQKYSKTILKGQSQVHHSHRVLVSPKVLY